jgi:hypothetical protein
MTAAYKLHRTSSTSVRSDWLLLPRSAPAVLHRSHGCESDHGNGRSRRRLSAAGGPALRNVHARLGGTCIVNTTMASYPQDLPLLRYS